MYLPRGKRPQLEQIFYIVSWLHAMDYHYIGIHWKFSSHFEYVEPAGNGTVDLFLVLLLEWNNEHIKKIVIQILNFLHKVILVDPSDKKRKFCQTYYE